MNTRPAPSPAKPASRRELNRDEITRSLEESLQRLRKTWLDVFLIHEPDNLKVGAETLQAFLDLQHQGMIGAFGFGLGRVAPQPTNFGQVIQSRYDPHGPVTSDEHVVRIFHGVLRNGGSHGRRQQTPATRIRHILEKQPKAAVIFSASTPGQIRQISERTA